MPASRSGVTRLSLYLRTGQGAGVLAKEGVPALLLLGARPALAGWLEGETAFCDLLGLTLVGVLVGWALVLQAAKRPHITVDMGLVVLAAPTLYLSVVIFFPSPERLMLVAPAVPLSAALVLRLHLSRQSGRQASPTIVPGAPSVTKRTR